MSTLALVAVGVIVVFIAYAVYASIQAGRKRTTDLQALAPQLGLSFIGEFSPTSGAPATGNPQNAFEALRAELGDFRRFQGSMQPRLANWMRGEKDGAQSPSSTTSKAVIADETRPTRKRRRGSKFRR